MQVHAQQRPQRSLRRAGAALPGPGTTSHHPQASPCPPGAASLPPRRPNGRPLAPGRRHLNAKTTVRRLTSDVRVSDPLNRPTEAKHRSDTNRTVEECLVSTFQRYLCDSQARTPTGDARARPRVPLSAAACMHASGASGARHRGRAQRPHTTARACACTKRSRPGSPPGTTHTAHTYPGPTCTHTPTSRACTRDHARSRRAARTRRRARRPLLGREVAKDIV